MENIKEILSFQLLLWNDYQLTVAHVLTVPLFLMIAVFLTRWALKIIEGRMVQKSVAPDVIHLVKRIIYVLAIIFIVITTLELINVPLTAFAFVSGAIAIGFGFGAQNIINNFISGWILMWERPIRIGDFLEVEGTSRGTVETINTRSTRIKRVDGVRMLIPNSKLLENTVVNWTLIDKLMRTSVRIGVAYGSPARNTSELLLQAVNEQTDVLQEPPPVVIFDDFGDNALMFEVYFWVDTSVAKDMRVVRSNIRFRIDELFEENSIVIAFPQRDVHLDGSLVVRHENQNAPAKLSAASEQRPPDLR